MSAQAFADKLKVCVADQSATTSQLQTHPAAVDEFMRAQAVDVLVVRMAPTLVVFGTDATHTEHVAEFLINDAGECVGALSSDLSHHLQSWI
jgi:hypothetical protein